MQTDVARQTLDDDLRRIGTWPRVLSVACLLALAALAVLLGYAWWWGILLAGAFVLVVLSLRVRASVTDREFVLRSYLRTYRFRFDQVIAFTDLPYQGWWSSYVPAELFGQGAYQIDVDKAGRGSRSLPATMCGKKRSARIADALNNLLPD